MTAGFVSGARSGRGHPVRAGSGGRDATAGHRHQPVTQILVVVVQKATSAEDLGTLTAVMAARLLGGALIGIALIRGLEHHARRAGITQARYVNCAPTAKSPRALPPVARASA